MIEYFRVAADIANAQSKLRPLDNEGLLGLIHGVYSDIKNILHPNCEGESVPLDARQSLDPQKSIRPKSITCLECGKSFRALTNPHLAMHGLDATAYREKWGFKKNSPLVCHELRRSRRRTMEGLQLWKSNGTRHQQEDTAQAPAPA